MKSRTGDLRYVQALNRDMIKLTFMLRKQVWPDVPLLEDYYLRVLPKSLDNNAAWLVYYGKDLIGLTGVFTYDEDDSGYDGGETIWLDWVLVLEEFRGQGFGKQIINDTIDYCKKLKRYKYMRLDTTFWEGRPAVSMYDKIMDLKEYYDVEKPLDPGQYYLIYTKVLGNWSIKPWNNQFLDINGSESCAG